MSGVDIKKVVHRTASGLIETASELLKQRVAAAGGSAALAFEGTAFFLPLSWALLGLEVKSLSDGQQVLSAARDLFEGRACRNGLVVEDLDGLLGQGLSALLALEVIKALDPLPAPGSAGFIPDTVLRSLGVQLVDGRIAGIAVILGAAASAHWSEEILRELQSKNIVTLLVGLDEEKNIRHQLSQKAFQMGLDHYVVPLGDDIGSAIYAVNFAIRAALTFGGFKGGQGQAILDYARQRVPVFVMVLGCANDAVITAGAGVLGLGFPVITDQDLPPLGKISTTKHEAIVVEKDLSKIVGRCIEARGIKVKVAKIDLPVLFGSAFEGERVRREQVRVESGSKYSPAVEFVTSVDMAQINDGEIVVTGPDWDQAQGQSLPLGILVEVAGRGFNSDYEPILERQIHRYINQAQGVMHMGQRDMIWIRVGQDAYDKGLRLKHFGKIIHTMMHQEFGAILDKVRVRLMTDPRDVEHLLDRSRVVFHQRDERLKDLTDESVDTFYSCALCQSFAPNHICVITPERLGLCGAYSWLDAKAAHEITPSGGNQPVAKGACLDPVLGQWKNLNELFYDKSNKTIPEVSMYSLLVAPQSSCGCFECIVAVVPEANGVCVVSRDHAGMTPLGMNFVQLAGMVGGGIQTPGFMGVGRMYVTSRKFISAEGGLARVVWMPRDLKEALKERIEKRAKEAGLVGFYHKIADETHAQTIEALVSFLEEQSHPALGMPPLIG